MQSFAIRPTLVSFGRTGSLAGTVDPSGTTANSSEHMTMSQSQISFLLAIGVLVAVFVQSAHPLADDGRSGEQLLVFPTPTTANAPAFATTIDNQSELSKDTDLLAETEQNYRRALAIDERSLGPDHTHVANRIIDLAVLLHNTSRLAEAEPLYRRALEINEKSLAPNIRRLPPPSTIWRCCCWLRIILPKLSR